MKPTIVYCYNLLQQPMFVVSVAMMMTVERASGSGSQRSADGNQKKLREASRRSMTRLSTKICMAKSIETMR